MPNRVFHPPWVGCLQIRTIHLIRESQGAIPPPIVLLVIGVDDHLPHICTEHCQPLATWWTPAPVVWPHQLELWTVATRDCIKKDYIINKVQCPFILRTATYYICMSRPINCKINNCIQSQWNNRRQFITDVGIFTLAVAILVPLQLAFGAIAVSWKSIYIRGVSIMLQLHIAKESTEGTYKVA